MCPQRVQDLRSSLGLSRADYDSKWIKIQTDAKAILCRNGIMGRLGWTNEVKEMKLAAAKELKAMHPDTFRNIPSWQSIVVDIFTVEIQKYSRSPKERSNERPKHALATTEKIVVKVTTPLMPNFNSHFLRMDLIVDGGDSMDRLYEILKEDGLDCVPPKYIVEDEYGSTLSSNRHLQAAFQRVANDGRLFTRWSVALEAQKNPIRSVLAPPPASPPGALMPSKKTTPTTPTPLISQPKIPKPSPKVPISSNKIPAQNPGRLSPGLVDRTGRIAPKAPKRRMDGLELEHQTQG